jgi:hypothetical protein
LGGFGNPVNVDKAAVRAAISYAFAVVAFFGTACSCDGQSPTAATTPTPCVGTGVTDPTATVSIDIGDLRTQSVDVQLRVGDVLFVGSNGCGAYVIPKGETVAPFLREVSRHQQAHPGPGDGSHTFEIRYQAMAPGRTFIKIACGSSFCSGISDFGSSVQMNIRVVPAAG